MSLRERKGEKPDLYIRVEGGATGGLSHVLVPLSDVDAACSARLGNQQIGIEIENSIKIEALMPLFDDVALIAIAFPGFGDGRGFSIAKSLRNRGYRGILRAVGPLIADQFAYAIACGFDEVELPAEMAARQPVGQWVQALGSISATYQRSHNAEGASILDRRRAARVVGKA